MTPWVLAGVFGIPFLFFFSTFIVGVTRKDFEYASLGFIGAFFSGFGVFISIACILGQP